MNVIHLALLKKKKKKCLQENSHRLNQQNKFKIRPQRRGKSFPRHFCGLCCAVPDIKKSAYILQVSWRKEKGAVFWLAPLQRRRSRFWFFPCSLCRWTSSSFLSTAGTSFIRSFEWLFWLSLKSPSPPDVWMIVWWSHLKQIINWFNCEVVSNIKTRLCWCYVKLYRRFHCIRDSSISVFCAGSLLWEESVQHIFPWTADLKTLASLAGPQRLWINESGGTLFGESLNGILLPFSNQYMSLLSLLTNPVHSGSPHESN